MTTALIVCTYQQPVYLNLILRSLVLQSLTPDEIIIAEDASSEETLAVINSFKADKILSSNIVHVSHEDNGFRKSTILNKAVAKSKCEKIVFLDGDCIPHPKYLENYSKSLAENVLLYSRPVYLSQEFVSGLSGRKNKLKFSIIELIRSQSRSVEAGLYIPWLTPRSLVGKEMIGSSWACMRSDFVAVNGFDERFNEGGYGYEDMDIYRRLVRKGVKPKSMKNLCIYYHFGIPGQGVEKSAQVITKNRELLESNDRDELVVAPIGISS